MNTHSPRTVLLIVIAVCFHFSVHATHSFTNFPGPPGFIEASHLSPAVKAMATAGMTPPTELIGIYYETNALAEILNNGRTSGQTAFWTAKFKGNSATLQAAKDSYAQICTNARKEAGGPLDATSPDIKSIWSHYESAAAKLKTNSALKIQGVVPLGVIAERTNVLAFSGLTNIRVTNTEEGWTTEMPTVFVAGFLRIGVSQVEIGLAYPFKDAQSIETANTGFVKWLQQIESQYKLHEN